ncbi:MAG: chorismate synthase [Lachnospiraceae bacterium]|jgi:chorismate synthase|nr:chorismate synthase [Lachnospiraceae bacterium]
MKNTFGNSLQITLFGESHGPYIGAVLDGLAPGLTVDENYIRELLARRRPAGVISTARVEPDEFQIVSGYFNGKTTGSPLTILIPNVAKRSSDYEKAERIARPGHADYTASVKYHGYEDFRGGGHFSGRITAALVAAGAVVLPALKKKGIEISCEIKSVAGIAGSWEEMEAAIKAAAAEGNSVGGVLEAQIKGVPAGVGEPWFDSVESVLAHAMYSIPAVKGVQFGIGFDGVALKGSEYNDSFRNEDGKIVTVTNNNGGINGGITNGMPIVFSLAIKPTPSVYVKQESIDLKSGENRELQIEGRHDPAIIHRAKVVVEAMSAIVMYDLLSSRYGTDYFYED